ncbi:MAG: Fic family protein [Pseudomonadota bacterium]
MTDLDPIKARIAEKRNRLDAQRPLSQKALASLEAWYDVELTHTSNAIEGNTLTRQETALVLEKGLTVRGKPLKDHQEAVDHRDALRFVRGLVTDTRPIGEADMRDIHRLVVASTLKGEAGQYSRHPRRIAGSRVVFPTPETIPGLMGDFGQWLAGAPATAETAIEAHLRLVSIHPFSDGNGRTARLLMNLVFMRGGYPPVVIRPEDRPDYVDALEAAQNETRAAYDRLMFERLEAALDDYLSFLASEPTP